MDFKIVYLLNVKRSYDYEVDLEKIMAFKNIFKDDNDINENVIGFLSFAVMVLFAACDLITGYFGKDLVVQSLSTTHLLS